MTTSSPENRPIEKPVLDQARQKKAREYSRIRRRLGFLETGLTLVLFLVLTLTGISRDFTGLFDWPPIAVAIVYLLVILVGFGIVTAPLSYYSSFVLPHRYGLSVQKLRGWLIDQAKGGGLSLVLASAAVAIVYWLLLNFSDFWWFIAWGILLLVSVIMSILAPVLLVPLFYKVRPLEDENLKYRLQRLADKAKARVHGIFTLDFSTKTTAANAALMGLGQTRRIVVSDTLLHQYTVPEIEVIAAHEIGHHMNRDILRLFAAQAVVSLVTLRIVGELFPIGVDALEYAGVADPAALPMLALLFSVFSTLFSPLQNTFSRYVESQADAYAIGLTNNPEAFIDSMTRLANQNLAVANPPAWEELLFYTHPSYNNRVKQARDWESRE
jgi:STE24 endopeptidase